MAVNYNYQETPKKVAAFRLGFDSYPQWFEYALNTGLAEEYCNLEAGKPTSIKIKNKNTNRDTIFAHHGDWVIVDEKGQIYARRNELFRKTHERI